MNDTARKRLWEDYIRLRTADLREKLILEYAPLVKVVAGRLSMYLGYNVEYDDLVSYGIFGLIDAIDKFDMTKEVKFETYASLRIRGAILDQIRKMDWIPRTIRQKQRQIDTAMKEIEQKTGRQATDAEIASYLGISEDEYFDWQNQLKADN
ncbi:MAG: sigma-70 family RNA polymerase sigma factor, partial [Lachnospiraceae bacterium]|nr:sigma-70 family RNA polymerase sigma factor [Lachnospiraceae bacterium]